jgi:hypothetical protein
MCPIEMKSSLHSKFPNEVNPKERARDFLPLIFLPPLAVGLCWAMQQRVHEQQKKDGGMAYQTENYKIKLTLRRAPTAAKKI